MKKIFIYMIALSAGFLTSCERELSSENVTTGEIAYPSIVVLGDDPVVQIMGGTYEDAGATAFLGVDDITDQMETVNPVDANVPAVYSVGYAVATTNVLGAESQANASRTVLITYEDVSGVDLSGTYLRNGNAAYPPASCAKTTTGIFLFNTPLGNGVVAPGWSIYYLGNDELVAPPQNSPYGRISATGSLTPEGFDLVLSFLDPPNTGVVIGRSFVKQ